MTRYRPETFTNSEWDESLDVEPFIQMRRGRDIEERKGWTQ